MELYVMRHGESHMNTAGRIMSSTDLPLTDKGVEQAKAAREYLGSRVGGCWDHVFSSNMKRAMQTAEIAGDLGQGWPKNGIVSTPLLREMVIGDLEGLTWEEAAKSYSHINIEKGLSYVSFPNGESIADIVGRCKTFIDTHINNLASDCVRVLIVTHGITKRILINLLLDKHIDEVNKLNWSENAGFSVLAKRADNSGWVALAINERGHLVQKGLGSGEFDKWGIFTSEDYIGGV